MKKLLIGLITIALLATGGAVLAAGGIISGYPETPAIVVTLNAEKSPTGELIPGGNVELMRFNISAGGNVLLGNFEIKWEGPVEIQNFRLFMESTQLGPTITVVSQEAASQGLVLLSDAFVPLGPSIGADTTTFSIRGDVIPTATGVFQMSINPEARCPHCGHVLEVEGVPLNGNVLTITRTPVTFQVLGEYSLIEAFEQALAGDTIIVGSGAYYLNGKGGWPILPGGVTIQGAGEKQTFLFGTIKSDGDLTNTTGDITIKDLTIVGPADSRAVISGGKRITLNNVTVIANGPTGVFAGWRDVSLKVNNSAFINAGSEPNSIGIEVAGELDPHDNLVQGNIFVNQDCGLSVPTQNFDSFSEMVLEHNEFYGVKTPVCRAAFG